MQEGCDRSCGECKKWEDHFYWNHVDKNRMHFFKYMVGDFTQRMSMPKNFVSHFTGQISEVVDLKPPSGNIWQVGVTKFHDSIILQSGWTEFIEAHRIEENDLLVFKYSGGSLFEVLIFDHSGCEKASSFFVKKDRQVRESDENSIEIINLRRNRPQELIEICSSSGSGEDDVKKTDIRRKSLCTDDKTADRVVQAGMTHGRTITGTNAETTILPKRPRGRPRKHVRPSGGVKYDVKNESQEADECEREMPRDVPYYSLTTLQLTKLQEEKVSKLALAVRPNPSFVAVMHESNITLRNSFLNVPRNFAAAHLSPQSQQIILRIPNQSKKWFASYLFKRQARGIHGGWRTFMLNNNLQLGDICLFELMKNKRVVTMTVHIII